MNTTRHIEQDDLALFAMQLLTKDEAKPILLHVEHCAECRGELAKLQGDLAVYAHTIEMHSPPAQARERLMKQVSREQKVVPIDRPPVQELPVHTMPSFGGVTSNSYDFEDELPKRSLGAKVLPWAGWAAAAGLAISTGSLFHERDVLRGVVTKQAGQLDKLNVDAAQARQIMDAMTDSTAMRVTLSKPQTTPAPQGRAVYVPEKGTLLFTASNMEPLLPAKVYELWLIPTEGAPIPAGTFQPDARGNASVLLPSLPKGVQAKAFGVTIENEGGATTPTMPIIMAGAQA